MKPKMRHPVFFTHTLHKVLPVGKRFPIMIFAPSMPMGVRRCTIEKLDKCGKILLQKYLIPLKVCYSPPPGCMPPGRKPATCIALNRYVKADFEFR